MVLKTLSKEKIIEEILTLDNWMTTCFFYTLDRLLPEESKLKKIVRKFIITYLGFIRFIMKNKLEVLLDTPNVLMSEIMDMLNYVTEMSIRRGLNTVKYNADKIPTCFLAHKDKFYEKINELRSLVEPIDSSRTSIDMLLSIPKDVLKYGRSALTLGSSVFTEDAFMQNFFKENINSLKQARSSLNVYDNIFCGTIQRESITNMLYINEYISTELPRIIEHNQEKFIYRSQDIPIQYFSYLSALIVILVVVFVIISMFTCLWKNIRVKPPSPLKLTYYGYGRKSRSRSVFR